MNKQEFLAELEKALRGLPQKDIEDRLTFYGEIIDDRTEEGLSEEEAVAAVGSASEIAAQIIADTPLSKIAKERIKPKRTLKAWEIILLAVGSPIWLSLIIAAIAVILSVYASLWAAIISLWAVFASVIACFIGFVSGGIIIAISNNTIAGIALIGAGIFCGGLSIFMSFGCKIATKGILILTKKLAIWIKNCFIKKEEA
ncbi:MAG: DUF1700 domain-containing protein [Clostridia bacterium]|nr:DUF1700 domain-containing protein [Clostridia bacterium]